MNIIDVAQGSEAWHKARLGLVTASRLVDVMAKGRGGNPSASRSNYEAELIASRLTGNPPEAFSTVAMQWGIDTEPAARATYELMRDVTIEEVGMVLHPTIEGAGCSPDGLIGEDGLIEIKCPNISTHMQTMLTESIPRKYMVQMQFQMACTGRAWTDFMSFDPRMPEHLSVFIKRVYRDEDMIKELEIAALEFLTEIEETMKALDKKYGSPV